MYKHLNQQQRYTISAMKQKGLNNKFIADAIGVHKSTVCRELKRNSGKKGYSHALAQEMADERKERIVNNSRKKPQAWKRVDQMLRDDLSPEQISGVLKKDGIQISHECIYQHIHKDKADGGDLYKHCRHMLKHRRRCAANAAGCRHIPNRTSISERPPEVDDKSKFGHWEMDTIVGKGNKGAILTLTERTTNLLFMARLPHGKNALEAAKTAVRLLLPYKDYVKTLTTDNGCEFACHEFITKKIGAKVYFADPYSSWQKGAVENINKLIRQYIKKGSDFDQYDDNFIKRTQMKINKRPRKKLGFEAPIIVFQRLMKKVALAG